MTSLNNASLRSSLLPPNSAGRQMGKKSRKSVSFSAEPDHHRSIENLEQLSEEDRSLIWFSREEFAVIKASYLEIINMMRNKELLRDTEEHCTRGLECRSKAGHKRRRDTQLNGLLAVLGEQERQQAEGVNDPDTMAVIYRQFSYHCQQAATNMGRRDEQAIAQYIADTQAAFYSHLRRPIVNQQSLSSNRRSLTSMAPLRPAQRNSRVKVMLGGSTSRRRAAAA